MNVTRRGLRSVVRSDGARSRWPSELEAFKRHFEVQLTDYFKKHFANVARQTEWTTKKKGRDGGVVALVFPW